MDNAVHRQIEQTMQTLMQQSTAPNRQTDPMGWTQWMNALQAQAEELAMQQIYSL
ncbi:TnpV protein [Gemmiger formicilis]|nr:TnpV protein [Gemmiger formicilis]